ncbi:MAG: acetyl-CoA carboxylase biotin carboxylase subunit [Dethiobacter sp.]|jgi:acetyl-CoA carboxylase biotin carboxylase subunit|nr:acetyl-CoA carboxylase biotin carboxylase subunit [Dethiobacter sp.]MBS3901414.1 acetyl-CoA carboxylase biotin carboxylase subunit [Dethiobacter sp.]MBS3988652.1 acetyl-CoA carboxylase biotin carboxylase subunit [Dethiobacter sp.]
MFSKVLIANRGEIAVRIIKSCQKLGIEAIAIYSDADAEAPHVKLAGRAFHVGPSRVSQSYLNMDRILAVAKEACAEAIHPGYGLLSENPEFARRCQVEGIIFIGPKPEVIAKMGGKVRAREIMKAAGVPIVAGFEKHINDVAQAKGFAIELGYPVMIKASAGGGGIGMQIVHKDDEMEKALKACQGRAKAYFDDDSVYMEKYLESPRHIEVQLLADNYGNTIHLFERECSIQRRHQKVVEEAPSAFVDEKLREKIGNVAVQGAKAIGYSNAGTVEFLMDKDKNFYFLEMNTRLQVEHPITEMITGYDLVEEQILVAAGKKLDEEKDKPKLQGHAIECRIYAEDPKTLLPSPGKVNSLTLPEGDFVRNDFGICSGYIVSPYYDPMLGKIITWGNDRQEAINRMVKALEDFQAEGIKVNIPILQKVISHPKFIAGETHTNLIEQILTEE